MQRENKQLLVLTHLSQLLDIITGFGGFIVPLILWLTQKDTVVNMDENGKSKNPKDFKEVIIMPKSTAGCQMFMAITAVGNIFYYKGNLNDGFIEQ